MTNVKPISVSLPDDLAAFAEAKVRSGEFASPEEVVTEAVRALAEHDAAIEAWLRDEVVPTWEAVEAGTMPTRSADETWARLQARIASDRRTSAAE